MLRQFITFLGTTFGKIILFFVIIIVTFLVERVVRMFINRHLEQKSKLIRTDPTTYAFMKHFISVIIYIIGLGIAIYTIPYLRTLSISLFAGAGILAIVIGFASQQALSNVVSGIFIAMFKPFRVGDRIKWANHFGVVEDITLRHTVVRNFENKRFVIPNSVISQETIENYNIGDEKICRWVEFGISYDSDVDKAIKIMQQEAMKHPEFIDVRTEEEKKEKKPAVMVRVMGYGDFAVTLRAWVWTKDPTAAFKLGTDLNKSIKKRFDKEGIEIPFPYRTLVFKDKTLFKKPKRRK